MDVLQLRHSPHGAVHAGLGGAEEKLGELLATSRAHLAFEFAAAQQGMSQGRGCTHPQRQDPVQKPLASEAGSRMLPALHTSPGRSTRETPSTRPLLAIHVRQQALLIPNA